MKVVLMSLMIVMSSFAIAADSTATDQQKAAMQAWENYSKPSDGHKHLQDYVGNWKYTSKWWMDAKAKPEVSTGTATAKMIMGERFLQMDVTGKAMNQDFTGMSIMGYDNLKKSYESTWIDNMTTGITTSQGQLNGKTLVDKGTMVNAMTGQTSEPFRNETKFKNKDKYTFTMFRTDANGKEFKAMEMEYTRVK